jgi:hypothetical protein
MDASLGRHPKTAVYPVGLDAGAHWRGNGFHQSGPLRLDYCSKFEHCVDCQIDHYRELLEGYEFESRRCLQHGTVAQWQSV